MLDFSDHTRTFIFISRCAPLYYFASYFKILSRVKKYKSSRILYVQTKFYLFFLFPSAYPSSPGNGTDSAVAIPPLQQPRLTIAAPSAEQQQPKPQQQQQQQQEQKQQQQQQQQQRPLQQQSLLLQPTAAREYMYKDPKCADGLCFNVFIGFLIMAVVIGVGTAMFWTVQKILIVSSQHSAAAKVRIIRSIQIALRLLDEQKDLQPWK